jgi:hypothetical protein
VDAESNARVARLYQAATILGHAEHLRLASVKAAEYEYYNAREAVERDVLDAEILDQVLDAAAKIRDELRVGANTEAADARAELANLLAE